MAEVLSLSELKAQNANAEDETEATDQPEQLEEDPKGEPVQATEVDDEAEAAESEQSEEVEAWMQSEEATSDDGQKGGFKPNPEAAKVRRKLRGKLKEKDDENEALKQRIAELEQRFPKPAEPSVSQIPPRPKREDFNYDDEAYDRAVDEWNDKKFEHRFQSHTQTQQEEAQKVQQQQAVQKQMQSAVNDHYERASELVNSGAVSEEAYTTADRNVRQAMENIFPSNGDAYTDAIIAQLGALGAGSEKVMYMLGNNPTKLAELQDRLRSDNSGMQAMGFLGALHSQATTPAKRKSTAPKPASRVDGNAPKGPEDAYRQKYKRAGGDIQKRIDIKREAKRNGVDTSNW